VTVLFLVLGLAMTGHAVLTPLLMVLIMITGDFLAMSLTTDNVTPSPMPNAWRIGPLTIAGVLLGACLLAFCLGIVAVGTFGLRLGTGALQSLAFVSLVFGGSFVSSGHHRYPQWDAQSYPAAAPKAPGGTPRLITSRSAKLDCMCAT
jgi:hypothetical protein